jgi:hypothetical protein
VAFAAKFVAGALEATLELLDPAPDPLFALAGALAGGVVAVGVVANVFLAAIVLLVTGVDITAAGRTRAAACGLVCDIAAATWTDAMCTTGSERAASSGVAGTAVTARLDKTSASESDRQGVALQIMVLKLRCRFGDGLQVSSPAAACLVQELTMVS